MKIIGTWLLVLAVFFVLSIFPRCHSFPLTTTEADLEDGFRFPDDYPDVLQKTCKATGVTIKRTSVTNVHDHNVVTTIVGRIIN